MIRKEFIAHMTEAAEFAKAQGAQFCMAVLFAQAALESGWGSSGLTRRANNLFGIKAGRSWPGNVLVLPTREWSKERGWYTVDARWRAYPSWGDCVVDYAHIIARLSWFRDALPFVGEPDSFLRHLLPEDGQPGWATDPDYFNKVRQAGAIIENLGGPKW